MPDITKKRNIILVSHAGAGKTSLAEALLHSAGAIPRAGSVDAGTSVSDYSEDEKERKVSINLSVLNAKYKDHQINILDAPGYADFIGEVILGLAVTDAAIVVINAAAGIEVGTDRLWKMLSESSKPRLVFINRLDKENTDFFKTLAALQARMGKACVPLCVPQGKTTAFKGTANLLTQAGMDKLDGEAKEKAANLRQSLIEGICESDDALLNKYLEGQDVSADELKAALRKGVAEAKVFPVLCGAATAENGARELLDLIVDVLPSPLEPSGAPSFSALVFKTVVDPFVGQLSVFRIFSGTIAANATVYNSTKEQQEKAGQILLLQGKNQEPLATASAGDIVALAKLKITETGDTLCDQKNPIILDKPALPEPAISFSVKPKSRKDEDKISGALQKLALEDLTFKVSRDTQTKEMIVSGLGDLHLEVMIKRLLGRFGVDVEVGTPKVAYKETIKGKGDCQYRHKKQTGGAGQFAEVWLRVEALERGKGFEFVDDVVGGAIPRPFIVSCEKGIKSALETGALAGFPVVDVRAVVYDGKTHPVDSKDIAFQIAARNGFKEAYLKASPVLLEPVMDVEVTVPDEYMGDVNGNLSSRRGRIVGMDVTGAGMQVVKAAVPLAEMLKYASDLRSMTQGRAFYTMRFSHYEEVPGKFAQAIIEQAKAQKKAEQEEN